MNENSYFINYSGVENIQGDGFKTYFDQGSKLQREQYGFQNIVHTCICNESI